MRRYCTAIIFTVSCMLTGMELDTSFDYYAEKISSVQIADQNRTTLPADTFMRAYNALLKLRTQTGKPPHLREIFNKCRNNYYTIHPQTISFFEKPLQLVHGQFRDPDIQLLCSFVLEKKPDCPMRGEAPVTVRAPKDVIAKVELKKKGENKLD